MFDELIDDDYMEGTGVLMVGLLEVNEMIMDGWMSS
jgi:hypothetical protein